MKEKIFQSLKQAYSPLGLGDGVLQAHAEALDATGLVTEDNLQNIVGAQKSFLEGLQKQYDTRASEAAKKAEERVRKQIEEETKRKEEEARKKAEDEAKEAERKKAEEDEAARKKAEEEAEAKRLEELKKREEVPEYFKKYIEEQAKKAKAYEDTIRELTESGNKSTEELTKVLKDLKAKNDELVKGYNAMKEESDKAKADAARRARMDFILNKAKELAIPQSRIDEGFVIAEDASEEDITSYLGKVAGNIKANALPMNQSFQLGDGSPSKEDTDAIAKMLVR